MKASGYNTGSLNDKINEAAGDGVITETLKNRAHTNIRVLGNDVVHDEWRLVSEDEVQESLHYAQRILEALYDDRAQVLKTLAAKGKQVAA